jgi:hypothetical protein
MPDYAIRSKDILGGIGTCPNSNRGRTNYLVTLIQGDFYKCMIAISLCSASAPVA